MTNTTTSTQLTVGQEGVLHMYAKEILHFKMEQSRAETAGRYDDVSYYGNKIAELKEERDETLAGFIASK